MRISVCIPVYNGVEVVKHTLHSVLGQTFQNFEVIIADDASTDGTAEVVAAIDHPSIKYYRYEENVGYPRNLERCRAKCTGDIIFLMGQDDILAQGTLERVHDIFEANKNVGAITRPYYWFHPSDLRKPIRAKDQLNADSDVVVSMKSDLNTIIKVFRTLDSLSGLAFRREYMDRGIHRDIFPAHVYPFASIFKNHEIVYLRDYTVAVRIESSQTIHLSSIYARSPLQSWIDMFNDVFQETKFRAMREYCIRNFVAKNFVGLVQIKNYGSTEWLLREISLLVKYNKGNLFDPIFWFFSIGTILVPRFVLVPIVPLFKEKILSGYLCKRVRPLRLVEGQRC